MTGDGLSAAHAEDALRRATSDMTQWLEQDYGRMRRY